MPDGKPAGVRCVQLTDDHRCALFGKPERPEVCNRFGASIEMCGDTALDAYQYLSRLQRITRPELPSIQCPTSSSSS
jgi:hypothetical protein